MSLTLQGLLADAFTDVHLWEVEERDGVAEKLADSVTERLLMRFAEDAAMRQTGERLQGALLSGDDLLIAAGHAGLLSEEPFAEAFSETLAEVLDEVIELTETDDAQALRTRLHGAVIERMRPATKE